MTFSSSQKNEIKKLIFILGSSIIFAFVTVCLLIFIYNPSGSYLAGNLLIAPNQIHEMHTKIDNSEFIYDFMNFHYFDRESKEWKLIPIDLEKYREIYDLINRDKSYILSEKEIEETKRNLTSTISIYFKEFKGNKNKLFQNIIFLNDSSIYLIEHPTDSNHTWVYFNHPEIEKKISKIIQK